MSSVDAAWLGMEDPTNLMMVTCLEAMRKAAKRAGQTPRRSRQATRARA
jgi:hypothetical protein